MYQRDLTFQRGLKNQVRIQFKNSDQKRVGISSTQTFVFSMYDAINGLSVVEKTLEVIDDSVTTSTRGLALLTLDEYDTINLPDSIYRYSISLLNSDTSRSPAYSSTYYEVSGVAALKSDTMPKPYPSIEIKSFLKEYNSNTNLWEHRTGNYTAAPNYSTGLHTVALFLTNYNGQLLVQATLDNDPNSTNKYATIAQLDFLDASGIHYYNFRGKYTFMQFVFIPAKSPADFDNDNPLYYGSFEKIVLRN